MKEIGNLFHTLWTGFIWFRIISSGGSFEHGTEPLSSLKGSEFHIQILRMKFAPWRKKEVLRIYTDVERL